MFEEQPRFGERLGGLVALVEPVEDFAQATLGPCRLQPHPGLAGPVPQEFAVEPSCLLQQLAAQRQQELVQPVMDRITTIIETMREEGQYSLILDVAAGSIISADSTLDLTPEVIRRLSASESGAAPAPAR